MKRISIALAAGLLLAVLAPRTAWSFAMKDVMTMTKDGIPDSLIVAKIQSSKATFELSADDLHVLKQAGVSNDVIAVMLRTENTEKKSSAPNYYGNGSGADDDYGYYDPDSWWVYDPQWELGFDFGFYAPYYRVYGPHFVGPRFPARGFGQFHVGRR
jgi:hypothetical protein